MISDQYTVAIKPEELHQLKNYLSIVYTFADLLIGDMSEEDVSRQHLLDIQTLTQQALDQTRDVQTAPPTRGGSR